MGSCLEMLLNKPVVLQLGDPIAAVHSTEEVILDELDDDGSPIKCGRAAMSVLKQGRIDQQGVPIIDPVTKQPMYQEQPVLVQVLRGEIEAISEEGLIFGTTGGDGKTQVLQYFPMNAVRAVSFACEHIPLEDTTSSIIRPN